MHLSYLAIYLISPDLPIIMRQDKKSREIEARRIETFNKEKQAIGLQNVIEILDKERQALFNEGYRATQQKMENVTFNTTD